MKKYALFVFLICAVSCINAEILLFTYSYNRPDFIEIQYKTFKKFLKDDYKFIVFNDARDRGMEQQINAMCSRYGIACIRIPQEIHERPYLKRWPGESKHAPAVRNCNVVQYSLNEVGFKHDDIVALFDSDMFLVKDFSIRNYLADYDLAGIKQGIGYLWIGLTFLDMRTMPNRSSLNFNCGRVDNVPVDAGGHTYCYLRDNLAVRGRYFAQCIVRPDIQNEQLLAEHKFNKKDIKFIMGCPYGINIEYMLDNNFLHYRGGTNWDNKSASYHNNKTLLLNTYMNDLLSD